MSNNELLAGRRISLNDTKRVVFSDSEPVAAFEGQLWVETTAIPSRIFAWNGSAWQAIIPADTFLLTAMVKPRTIISSDYTTVWTEQDILIPSGWGMTILYTTTDTGVNARLAFYGPTTVYFDLGGPFYYYELFPQGSLQRFINSSSMSFTSGPQLINVLDFPITKIELQVRRVNAITSNVAKSLNIWAHPR